MSALRRRRYAAHVPAIPQVLLAIFGDKSVSSALTWDDVHDVRFASITYIFILISYQAFELGLGWKRTVTTIEGKQLPIEKGGPTQPGSCDSFPSQGMPISKKPGQRGNFIVKYNVKFPTTLTAQQKQKLREIL